MGRPATCLTSVNELVSTLEVTPHAAALIAVARSLARKIDAADAETSGAVAQAMSTMARQLSDVLEDVVTICTANDPDPLLSWLNDRTDTVPHPT